MSAARRPFVAFQETILKKLRSQYGIRSAVTEAVEVEILRPGRKLGTCCQPGFRKALDTGLLTVLDRRTLGQFTTNDPHSTYDSIQLRGLRYNNFIDRGEAYSHAAAHVLRSAVLSNDWKAFIRADAQGLETGKPTLRVYDLVVFLYQCGELSEKDCDGMRKSLYEAGDLPHEAFKGRKFTEGLPHFYPRLVSTSHPIVGSVSTTELGDDGRVEIRTVARPQNPSDTA